MNESTSITPVSAKKHLPLRITLYVLVIIFTQWAILLINQPATYWSDPQNVSEWLAPTFLLNLGPVWYILIGTAYMGGVYALLRFAGMKTGVFLASGIFMTHLLLLIFTSMTGIGTLIQPGTATSMDVFTFLFILPLVVIYLLLLFIPPERRWNRRFNTAAVIAIFIWCGLLILEGYRSAHPMITNWTPVFSKHSPGPRTGASIAYDSFRKRAIMYGGAMNWNSAEKIFDTTTWEWNGEDWEQITTTISPPGRIWGAMVFDPDRGTVLLYGGKNKNGPMADLWEWNGVDWKQLSPPCNPVARYGADIFYDQENKRVVLYGGGGEEWYADSWTWQGGCWQYFGQGTSSPATVLYPFAYDTDQQQAYSLIRIQNTDTWVWKGDVWTKIHPEIQPPERVNAVMVYDPSTKVSLLFGGGEMDKSWRDDTWLFDGKVWKELHPSLHPSLRFGSAAFYDETRKSILIYGGEYNNEILDDMWEFKSTGAEE